MVFADDIANYLPEHIKPLAEQLKQFPRGFEKWVYAPAFPTELYQGDILTPLSSVAIDENGDVTRAELDGMVISNTCDAQLNQGEFLLIAPVFNLEDYRKNSNLRGEDLDNHIRALMDNKISQLMFLPESDGVRGCFVDFARTCPVSLEFFHSDKVQKKRVLSLSQYGHYFLLVKLAYHFTRPEAPDSKRGRVTAPAT